MENKNFEEVLQNLISFQDELHLRKSELKKELKEQKNYDEKRRLIEKYFYRMFEVKESFDSKQGKMLKSEIRNERKSYIKISTEMQIYGVILTLVISGMLVQLNSVIKQLDFFSKPYIEFILLVIEIVVIGMIIYKIFNHFNYLKNVRNLLKTLEIVIENKTVDKNNKKSKDDNKEKGDN